VGESIIVLKDASIYQNDFLVLNSVNLNIEAGEFVYLIGKTGSGKSSLLKTLYGELPLNVGEGTVNGFTLNTSKPRKIYALRRSLGIVFQDFQLLMDRTVEQNLVFVLNATGCTNKMEIKSKIKEVLQLVNMQDKSYKMPHQLSGGEQQRVAIARALLNDPELILADEPSGNLDPQTSIEIMEVLRNINANGKTVVIATHDYALLLKYPAKTLKFEDGKVYEVVQKAV